MCFFFGCCEITLCWDEVCLSVGVKGQIHMHTYRKIYKEKAGIDFQKHPSACSGETFSATSRVLLPQRQPGGWSARGQPCDAVHSFLRQHMTAYLETCLGYRNSLMKRAHECPVLMSNGNIHLAVSNEESIISSIYGWKRLAKRKKVLRQVFFRPKRYNIGTFIYYVCVYRYTFAYFTICVTPLQ